MKKVLCVVLALLMVASMGVTALATGWYTTGGGGAAAAGGIYAGTVNVTTRNNLLYAFFPIVEANGMVMTPVADNQFDTWFPATSNTEGDRRFNFAGTHGALATAGITSWEIRNASQVDANLWYGQAAAADWYLVVNIQNIPTTINNFSVAFDYNLYEVTAVDIGTGAATAWDTTLRRFVLNFDVRPLADQTGVIPTNWRVRGLDASGVSALFGSAGQVYLNDLNRINGDRANRELVLTPEMFTWERRQGTAWVNDDPATLTGISVTNPLAMRLSHLDRVSVVTNRTSGMNGTIRDVELHWEAGSGVAIRVRTPVYMTRTGTTDVEFDVSFRFGGGSTTLLGRVAMVVGNDRFVVNRDDESVAPTHRQYLRPTETVRNIEIYAGQGVTFTRNITGEQSIYVAAALATDDASDELFRTHPELVDIIDIHHNGFNAANVRAEIDSANVYFVYDANRRLIGTTDDNNLPFSTRYYLTRAQVNLGGVEDPADDDNGDTENPPAGGAPGGGSSNANHNPGTGR
jgi:hypothetical protein